MNGMLAAGAPAAEVMTEYARACRRLGHSVPEPAHLHAAYTCIQAWFEQNAPEIDALAITGIDLSDGILTLETEWDATNEADATDLCGTALDIDITGTVTAVEVIAADGTTLAEC